MAYVKFLSVIALIGSIAWVIADPGFEPALAVLGSISALVSVFLVQKRTTRRLQQHQSVSKSSIGVQAGGDVSIENIGGDKSGLFETWSESAMKNFTLTSVGIAIGYANIKRLVGEFANLSIWIN